MSGGAAFLPSIKKNRPHDSRLVDRHPPLDFNSSGDLSHHSAGLPSVFISPKKAIKEPEKPQPSDSIDTLVSDFSYPVQPTYQWQPPPTYTIPYVPPTPVYQDYQNFSATDDKFALKKILRSLNKAFYFLKDVQEKSTWKVVIDALNANSKDKKYENYIFLYGILCFHCEDSKTIRAIVPTNSAFKFLAALHDDKHDLSKEQLVSYAQCYFSGVSSVCKKQNLLDIIYDDCLKCKALKSGNYEEFMLEVKAKEFIEKCKEKEKARDVELTNFRKRSPDRRRVSQNRNSRDKSIEDRKRSRSRHRYKSPSSRSRSSRKRSKSHSSNHSRSSRKRSRSKSRSSNRSRSKKRSYSKSSSSSKRSPKPKKSLEDDMDGFIVLDECIDKMEVTNEKEIIENINSSLVSTKENIDNLLKTTERTDVAEEKPKSTPPIPSALETKKEEPGTNLSTQEAPEEKGIVEMEGFIILDECDENLNPGSKPNLDSAEVTALDSGEEELKVLEDPPKNEVDNTSLVLPIPDSKSTSSKESDFRISDIDLDLEGTKFSDVEMQKLEPLDLGTISDVNVTDADGIVSEKLPSIEESIPDKLLVLGDQNPVVSEKISDITEERTDKDPSSEDNVGVQPDSSDKDNLSVQPDSSQTALSFQDGESFQDGDNNEISLSIMKAYEYQNQEDMNREENFFDEIDRILVDFEKQNALDQIKVEDASEVRQMPENEQVQQSNETPSFQHSPNEKLEDLQEAEDTKAVKLDAKHDVGQGSAEETKENDGDPFAEGENSNSSHSNESTGKYEKPVDFKTRIKNEQISNSDLKAIVDLIKANDKTTKEKYVLKKGMLCEKTSAGEVRIVTHPEGIRSFCFIIHTMAGTHAPYNNALEIFRQHFMPYNGIEAVMEEVIATCEKCFRTV